MSGRQLPSRRVAAVVAGVMVWLCSSACIAVLWPREAALAEFRRQQPDVFNSIMSGNRMSAHVDPWNNPWVVAMGPGGDLASVSPEPQSIGSSGPNGVWEQGFGDDVLVPFEYWMSPRGIRGGVGELGPIFCMIASPVILIGTVACAAATVRHVRRGWRWLSLVFLGSVSAWPCASLAWILQVDELATLAPGLFASGLGGRLTFALPFVLFSWLWLVVILQPWKIKAGSE